MNISANKTKSLIVSKNPIRVILVEQAMELKYSGIETIRRNR
jgi:hypothetical protein